MNTHTSAPVFFSSCKDEEESNITILRYEPVTKTQSDAMPFTRRLVKWFGMLSTLALGAAALAPATFNIPLSFRPWVFVAFIFWFFGFCAGLFNL